MSVVDSLYGVRWRECLTCRMSFTVFRRKDIRDVLNGVPPRLAIMCGEGPICYGECEYGGPFPVPDGEITLTPEVLAILFEQDDTPERVTWLRDEFDARLRNPTDEDTSYVARLVEERLFNGIDGVCASEEGYTDDHAIYQDPRTGQVLLIEPDPFDEDEDDVCRLAIFPAGMTIPRSLIGK
jgi:hypothetical protein